MLVCVHTIYYAIILACILFVILQTSTSDITATHLEKFTAHKNYCFCVHLEALKPRYTALKLKCVYVRELGPKKSPFEARTFAPQNGHFGCFNCEHHHFEPT